MLPSRSGSLVVAFAACRRRNLADPCDPTDVDARIDVLFRRSPDGGATWASLLQLTDASTAPYRINDEPSIALTSTAKRIAFDSYQPSFSAYQIRMRSIP